MFIQVCTPKFLIESFESLTTTTLGYIRDPSILEMHRFAEAADKEHWLLVITIFILTKSM